MTEKKVNPPLIGDFSGPQNNAPRKSPELQRKDDPQTADAAIKEVAETQQARRENEERNRVPSYEEGLKEAGISLKEARVIIDSILFQQFYSETIQLSKQFEVVFRTRLYEDNIRAMKYLEVENPSYPQSINDLLARYNLAASLLQYGETSFEFPSKDTTKEQEEKLFDIRLQFVKRLPIPVIMRLLAELNKFDYKVSAALADGAPEDF